MTPRELNEMSGVFGGGSCMSEREIQNPSSRYEDVHRCAKTSDNIIDTSSVVVKSALMVVNFGHFSMYHGQLIVVEDQVMVKSWMG